MKGSQSEAQAEKILCPQGGLEHGIWCPFDMARLWNKDALSKTATLLIFTQRHN